MEGERPAGRARGHDPFVQRRRPVLNRRLDAVGDPLTLFSPMSTRQLCVVAVDWSLLLLTPVACGARTANVCLIPSGTYVQHFTVVGADPCPSIPDQMVTIENDGAIAGGSGADGGWPHCEINVGSSTCESSLICDTKASGISTIVSTTLTLQAGSVSGKESIVATDPMLFSHCDYDITITK